MSRTGQTRGIELRWSKGGEDWMRLRWIEVKRGLLRGASEVGGPASTSPAGSTGCMTAAVACGWLSWSAAEGDETTTRSPRNTATGPSISGTDDCHRSQAQSSWPSKEKEQPPIRGKQRSCSCIQLRLLHCSRAWYRYYHRICWSGQRAAEELLFRATPKWWN